MTIPESLGRFVVDDTGWSRDNDRFVRVIKFNVFPLPTDVLRAAVAWLTSEGTPRQGAICARSDTRMSGAWRFVVYDDLDEVIEESGEHQPGR